AGSGVSVVGGIDGAPGSVVGEELPDPGPPTPGEVRSPATPSSHAHTIRAKAVMPASITRPVQARDISSIGFARAVLVPSANGRIHVLARFEPWLRSLTREASGQLGATFPPES